MNNKAYLKTLYNKSYPYYTQIEELWEYSPLNDSWTKKIDWKLDDNDQIALSINNIGYVLKGRNFYKFDTLTYNWIKMASTPNSYTSAYNFIVFGYGGNFSIGSHGYLVGASLNDINTNANDLWEYNPDSVGAITSLPIAVISRLDSTLCLGDSLVLNANAEEGLSYQWKKDNSDISGATFATYTAKYPGNYTIKTTNSIGSTISTGIKVKLNTIPTAVITPIVSTMCEGDSLRANSNPGWTYQ